MDVRGYIESNAREFTDDLKQWLTIPSVSADPARHGDVRRSAEWLAAHLRGAGFPVAEVLETGGLPAVFAEWPAAGPDPKTAPVVLVYGHRDVQPAERFYDSVLPLSDEERGLLAKLPFDEKHWLAEAGESGAASGEQGFSTLERIWARPAVLAGRRAMQRAFGGDVLFTREGGSGPEADLAEILDAPLVFVAVGLDSDQIHAPNESVDTSLLLRGAEASAYLWPELAAADLR